MIDLVEKLTSAGDVRFVHARYASLSVTWCAVAALGGFERETDDALTTTTRYWARVPRYFPIESWEFHVAGLPCISALRFLSGTA